MKIQKRTYKMPEMEVIQLAGDASVMIEIGSGETSPEESDANRGYIDTEDDYLPRQKSLWD